MFGRDKSERFKSALPSPGPGDYDPNHLGDIGFKTDPNSGFKSSGRFSTTPVDDESGNMSTSPRRRIPSRPGSRTTDWTTNRIKDLETELRISKAKVAELEQVIRESGMSPEMKTELEDELHELKNKFLAQKGSTAQAQREKIKAEAEKKKLENELANLSMKVKKDEESRKIAEAKVSEARFRSSELEKQLADAEDEYATNEESFRREIQTLKKKLATAESSAAHQNQSQSDLNTQLSNAKQLSQSQQDQLTSLEEELTASKAATERLISENFAQILVMKAELTVASEREAEMEELVARLRAEIQDLKDRLERVLAEKAELEAELATLRAENEEKANQLTVLTEELKQAEAELKDRDQSVIDLQSKLTAMEDDKHTTADSLRDAEQTVGSLRADLASKSRDVQTLESRVEEITKSFGEEFTPDEDQDLDKKLEKFTQIVNARQDKIVELEKLTEGQTSELKHLGNKVATVLKEKKAKVGELERQKKEEKSLRRSLAEQENTMNSLTEQLEAAEARTKEEAENRSNLQNELKMVRLQLGEKTVEAAELQQKAEDLTKEVAEKSSDGDSKAQTLAQLQSELSTTKTELDARHATVQELQAKVALLEGNVGERGTTLSGLQEQLNKLGSERDTLQSNLASCKKDLAQSKQQNKKKDEAVAELKKELSKVESKLSKATESKKKAESTAEEALKQKADLEEKLARSKTAYKSMQSTVSSQTNELAKLNAEKRQLETQMGTNQVNTEKSSGQLAKKLEAAMEALKQRDDEIRDLQVEIGNVAKSSDDVKGVNTKTQSRLNKAENDLRHKTSLVQDLQAQVKALRQENTELSRQQEAAGDTAKSKLAEKDKKLQRLERELALLKEKAGEASVDDHSVEHGTENELRALLQQQKKRYESQIRALKLEPTSIKELRAEVAAAQAIANSSRRQNEALKEQLREVKERLAFFEGSNPANDGEDEVEILKEALREAERKVNESQKLAAQYRHQLKHSDTLKLEMERLECENSHLHRRSEQLSADVSGLMMSSGTHLGHHNNKQKIQYHLKLKTELEELRKEYTVLSREKFKLEQAIRYMAARSDLMSGNPVSDVTGTGVRHPSAALAPSSTKDSVMLSTPTAKNHMKWTSRGRGTTKTMSAYKPRESMERGIEETQIATVVETEAFKQDVTQQSASGPSDSMNIQFSSANEVENKILSTISSVVGGRRRRKSIYE